jgi:hypothetical protein
MPAPNVVPVFKERPIDPLEAEVLRLQKLLNDQQAQVMETTKKLQEALQAIPERTQPLK